ncbi:hypothetical protein JTB14_021481 [Gonioctena quinquepunctata]|nr:hypothetical protein JTB14_021481 [Gonioctena quinquepunctata]
MMDVLPIIFSFLGSVVVIEILYIIFVVKSRINIRKRLISEGRLIPCLPFINLTPITVVHLQNPMGGPNGYGYPNEVNKETPPPYTA